MAVGGWNFNSHQKLVIFYKTEYTRRYTHKWCQIWSSAIGTFVSGDTGLGTENSPPFDGSSLLENCEFFSVLNFVVFWIFLWVEKIKIHAELTSYTDMALPNGRFRGLYQIPQHVHKPSIPPSRMNLTKMTKSFND